MVTILAAADLRDFLPKTGACNDFTKTNKEVLLVEFIFALVLYLVICYVMAKIGAKFQIGSMGQYFIPLYGQVLICRCARVSPWWIIGMLIPYVNIAVNVYVNGSLAKQLGKSFWMNGLGSLILGIPLFIMAFDKSQPVETLTSVLPPPAIGE